MPKPDTYTMARFADGPFYPRTFMVKRAPIFIRVVISTDGKFDVLDLLDDTVRPDENACAYLVDGDPVPEMIDGKKSGYAMAATYYLCEQQPPDDVIRDNVKWREWCKAEFKIKKKPVPMP